MPTRKDAAIVIVGGAGTIGSSTALHLARRGYTNIRVLDMFQPPSLNSAGNDMNKVGSRWTMETHVSSLARNTLKGYGGGSHSRPGISGRRTRSSSRFCIP